LSANNGWPLFSSATDEDDEFDDFYGDAYEDDEEDDEYEADLGYQMIADR
jgi:hypothetical protein